MAIVAPVVNDSNLYETTQSSQANELQDMFMTLLTAQMQHQDPLNPMENTEFTSQLAEFTSLEQLQAMNENMEYLQLYMASINNSQALSFIGKEVVTNGNTIYYDGVNSADINFKLAARAGTVNINIYDENSALVDTIQYGEMAAGEQSATWFGKDKNGNNMPAGNYSFEIYATDTEQNTVNASTYSTGVVDGITFIEGVGYVLINDQQVAIGDIIEIREKAQSVTNHAAENAYDLIGKDVIAKGNKIYWDQETQPYVSYELAETADIVKISVYDENGKLMRTFDSDATAAGLNSALWDGRKSSDQGTILPAGEYSFTVNAYDSDGSSISVTTKITGEVQGVTTASGTTYIKVAGLTIPAADVIEVQQSGSLGNFATQLLENISETVQEVSGVAAKIAPYFL